MHQLGRAARNVDRTLGLIPKSLKVQVPILHQRLLEALFLNALAHIGFQYEIVAADIREMLTDAGHGSGTARYFYHHLRGSIQRADNQLALGSREGSRSSAPIADNVQNRDLAAAQVNQVLFHTPG